MAAAPQGILLARKYAKDGVTVAIAMHGYQFGGKIPFDPNIKDFL